MAQKTRHTVMAGLLPNAWVPVFQLDHPYGQQRGAETVELNPMYRYHHVDVDISADAANGAAATLKVQESDDGTTWMDRYTHPAALVPGGQVSFDTYHVRRYVRLIAFSTAGGSIRCQLNTPELQSLPNLLQTPLSCATWCECDCETGSET